MPMIDTCYVGDVRDGLRAFAAAGHRAQTCVTSPPYWGLRDYGTAQWDGGDAECDHKQETPRFNGPKQSASQVSGHASKAESHARRECGQCGARRIDRQLGLEPTIAEYVANMVEVFRCVRDALADDGTLWLNLGDSYNTQAGAVGSRPGGGGQGDKWADKGAMTSPNRMPQLGLKPKDLCGIPWRVAFALQADGWWLRSDIIWHKPNPMPESITDRPTKAHEYLFLLAKSERYYYDAAAIAELAAAESAARYKRNSSYDGEKPYAMKQGPNGGTTRNKRTVWTVATKPYAEAHFATFPPALIEPCILAGSRAGDVVLDPFMGSGTAAHVAQSLGRRWFGTELNPNYVKMQQRRTAQAGMELAASAP